MNGLHRGGAGGTNVIDDHDPRALLAEAFNDLSSPMLLFRLTHQKSMQLAAYHRNRYHDGVGAHGESADRFRLPPPLPDFVEKHLTGQASALGVKRRGSALDGVVAGAAGRQFELAQTERLVGEKAQ